MIAITMHGSAGKKRRFDDKPLCGFFYICAHFTQFGGNCSKAIAFFIAGYGSACDLRLSFRKAGNDGQNRDHVNTVVHVDLHSFELTSSANGQTMIDSVYIDPRSHLDENSDELFISLPIC